MNFSEIVGNWLFANTIYNCSCCFWIFANIIWVHPHRWCVHFLNFHLHCSTVNIFQTGWLSVPLRFSEIDWAIPGVTKSGITDFKKVQSCDVLVSIDVWFKVIVIRTSHLGDYLSRLRWFGHDELNDDADWVKQCLTKKARWDSVKEGHKNFSACPNLMCSSRTITEGKQAVVRGTTNPAPCCEW